MTIATGSHQYERGPTNTGGIEVTRAPADDVLELRRRYVIAQRWFDDSHESDADLYDMEDNTLHLAKRSHEGLPIAAMRLTRVASVQEALSYEILETNSDMQQSVARQAEADREAEVAYWDLTRLVHAVEGSDKVFEGMLELFGAGLAATRPPRQEKTPVWLFATTADMKDLLDACGIENSVWACGRITPSDERESYFCVVHPVQAMETLRQKQEIYAFAHEHVSRGLELGGNIPKV